MKCLLSLIRYTSNTLKAKVRLKDWDQCWRPAPDVGNQEVENQGESPRSDKTSEETKSLLPRHPWPPHVLLPQSLAFPLLHLPDNPFRAVESLVAVLSTDCSLFPRVTSHILSGLHRPPLHPREHVRSGTRSVDTYVPFSGYIALCPRFTAFVLFYGFFMGPFFGHHPRCHR